MLVYDKQRTTGSKRNEQEEVFGLSLFTEFPVHHSNKTVLSQVMNPGSTAKANIKIHSHFYSRR